MRHSPPLSALRAFEAGARLLSFTKAAEELCVTPAAISHQIRRLEDWLGLKLFERRGHHLILTPKGTAYLQDVGDAFDSLSRATSRLRGNHDGPLRITALPSFASQWLVPRLGRFREAHPEVNLRLSSSATICDIASGRFDLGIRSGLGRWPGLKAKLIAPESLTPLCSPDLAETQPLQDPSDLLRMRLLHDTPKDGWSRWFESVGTAFIGSDEWLAFDDAGLMLQAALRGQGVALGRLMLAADAIESGRLVRPFEAVLPNDYSYWLVYPRGLAERSDVMAFCTWLLSEAKPWRIRHRPRI